MIRRSWPCCGRAIQRAYQRLIRRFHGSLVGVAAAIIGSHAQGEEVVQDAWLAVHAGIGRFEGRSSLITWLFSIVLNRARTRASREARTRRVAGHGGRRRAGGTRGAAVGFPA